MNARWLFTVVLLAVLVVPLVACRPNGTSAPPSELNLDRLQDSIPTAGPNWFDDITQASGIAHTYRNGEDTADHLSILESLGGGIGLIDYDRDGLMDVFIPGGGIFTGADKRTISGWPCKLYRNLGQMRFQDVTAQVGLEGLADGKPWFYSHAAAVADVDRDGWPDLLVTGWERIALFRNVPVDPQNPSKGRRFEDVSQKAGLAQGIQWATSAAWGDLDGDGYPDLYVCQYVDWSWQNNPKCDYDGKTPDVCPPKRFSGLQHKVYRNNGDGTFTDQTATAGLLPGGKEASKGLGVLIVDLDSDRKPDIYVCNDTVDQFLYMNVSTPGQLRFKEQGMASGSARDDKGWPNGSMGVDAGDYERSGKPAIWVTNYENELHALYRNECRPGQALFTFQTHRSGVAALGQTYVGWGTGFIDFDLDGWEDLFVANGHAIRYPTGKSKRRQKPVLMRNNKGRFEAITPLLGSFGQTEHLARGAAFGDLDNDGRVDIVVSRINEPVAVLHNIAPLQHWLGVELLGKQNACTVGARLVLTADGQTQTRFRKGGGSYCSSNDPRLVFGLGQADRATLTIHWPDGAISTHPDLAVDRYHRIEQPAR
jgi:hypothetical protein